MNGLDIAFVGDCLSKLPPRRSVVEIGSREINGSVRYLFGDVPYVGVDLYPGPGVDVVTDALDWQPDSIVDTVVCLNVLEHTPKKAELFSHMRSMLDAGGVLIVSGPTDGWPPHSQEDGRHLRADEYYANLDENDVWDWCQGCSLIRMEIDDETHQLFVLAVK